MSIHSALPSSPLPSSSLPVPVPRSDWRADLRFFATCYVAGLAFFLIMLS